MEKINSIFTLIVYTNRPNTIYILQSTYTVEKQAYAG